MLVYQRVNMVKTLDLDGKSLAPNDDLNGINQMISDDLRVSPVFLDKAVSMNHIHLVSNSTWHNRDASSVEPGTLPWSCCVRSLPAGMVRFTQPS